jgi:hypothetical protein
MARSNTNRRQYEAWPTPWTTEHLLLFAKSEAERASSGVVQWQSVMNRFYDMRIFCKANNLLPSDPTLSRFFSSEIVQNIRVHAAKQTKQRKGRKRVRKTSLIDPVEPSRDTLVLESAQTLLPFVRSYTL